MLGRCSSNFEHSARGRDPDGARSSRMRSALLALVVGVCAFALLASSALAEGSVDLNTGPDGNRRQGLSVGSGPGTTVGTTALFVYAQAGETIQLASSAMGVGTGNALLYPPPGAVTTPIWNCTANDPGTGLIATGAAGRAQELAGPEPTAGDADPNTYGACEYVVPAGGDGIYRVVFESVNGTANSFTNTVADPVQAAGANIAIWDVTVRDSGGVVQPGRAYSYRYVLATGGDGSSGVEVFVQTPTGYEYRVNLYNQGGANWALSSNDKGVINAATGERLFASFACGPDNGTNTGCVPAYNQAVIAPPQYPVFLNSVDPIAVSGPGGLAGQGFSTTPISPASNPLSNTFTGSGGQPGVTNRGSGGTFNLTSPAQMAGLGYTLEIDSNRNGTFGDAPDVVDDGELEADGSTSFGWNGQDGAGAVPACGDYPYRIRSTLSEVHFAMLDVEFSGGTRIERLTLPNDPALGNPLAASYNDRDPFKNGYIVTTAQPPTVNNGISGQGFHAWGVGSDGLGSGNQDYIDTWSKLPEVQTTGTLRLACADVQVTKSAKTSPMIPGKNGTYNLTVKNNGPDTATNVKATDQLPKELTFVSASSGCANANGTVTCTLGSLASGDTHTFEITVKTPSSLKHCVNNTGKVTNDVTDPNLSNNESTVCAPIKPETDLSITKVASDKTVPPGGQVMYTLVVHNDGPSDAEGVKVTDPMANGLSLVSAKPSQGTCSTSGGKVACNIGDLEAGGSAQVLVTATVTAPSGSCGASAINNTGTVSSDNEDTDQSNNKASASICTTPDPQPKFDLVVAKKADDKSVYVGEPVKYTVTVTNKGPDAAPNAKVTDTLNHPASVVSVKSTQGKCTKSIPMTCQLGTIKAGGKVTITVTVKLRESGCEQRNAASATGEGADTNPANNLARVDVCAKAVPLRLTKVADKSTLRAGSLVGYTIRVSNPTSGEAQDVDVCDKLPSGLVYVSSKAKAKYTKGQYCWHIDTLGAHKSKSYRITVRALGSASGDRTNRATASAPGAVTKHAKDPVHVLGARASGGGVTG
jgi:uncharacterized repeat protein (TIGR01451 family)